MCLRANQKVCQRVNQRACLRICQERVTIDCRIAGIIEVDGYQAQTSVVTPLVGCFSPRIGLHLMVMNRGVYEQGCK